jgi:hypothetical protein
MATQMLITKEQLASKSVWPNIVKWFKNHFTMVDAETLIAGIYDEIDLPSACGWANCILQAFLKENDRKVWGELRRTGASGRGMANTEKKSHDINFSKRI